MRLNPPNSKHKFVTMTIDSLLIEGSSDFFAFASGNRHHSPNKGDVSEELAGPAVS
jgi:hypothetical protein